MNKIDSSQFCYRLNAVIPAREFCHRRTTSVTKTWQAGFWLLLLCSGSTLTYASIVNGEYNYQTYRDFAENKGEFTPDTSGIKIYKKNNNTGVPDMVLHPPMPDFSSVDKSGIATLLAPSYIVSVAHNVGFTGVSYGSTSYKLVSRNLEGDIWVPDIQIPRLDKFVVETMPANLLPFDMYKEGERLSDQNRFPIGVRLGSGSQAVSTDQGNKSIAGPYVYLTGGTVEHIWYDPKYYPVKEGSSWLSHGDNRFNKNNVLDTFPLGGDSGSPFFVWDNITKKWEVVGVLHSTQWGSISDWSHINKKFLDKIIMQDTDPEISLSGEEVVWGARSIFSSGKSWEYHGINNENKDFNKSKHLIFSGGGSVILLQSVNQGAGGIFFDKNNRYAFYGKNGASWTGAGLYIPEGTVVGWSVNGVKNDYLHKLGAGILEVNGTGINEGGLKTGDGTVILSQHPDESGRVQAFSTVNIVSGRPTVVLGDNRQINPDNISWGLRGGTLDINGNDILFHKINATDNGAVITNSSNVTSLLTISPVSNFEVRINDWDQNWRSGGEKGLLYKYNNGYTNTTDYFIQNKKGYGYFPINQSSNSDWEFVGHDEQAAKKRVLSRKPKDNFVFHGNFTGNINVKPDTSASTGGIAFDGNIFLPSNTLSQSGGELIFQGHPVIHAYNTKAIADKLASMGDDSVRTQPVSFNQSDWETRTFLVKKLSLQDSSFRLARNAVMVGDINASHSAVTLGSPSLWIDLNDGNEKSARVQEGISVARNEYDMSDYHGNITLKHQSTLDIREKFSGGITAHNSTVSVASRQAALNEYSIFRKTPLILLDGARMVARNGFRSDSSVTINPAALLTLSASPGVVTPGSYIPAEYRVQSFKLSGSDVGIQIRPWTYVVGNIEASGSASIIVGDDSTDAGLDKNLSFRPWLLSARFQDYRNIWQGRAEAEHARISLISTDWRMSANSRVHDMKIADSQISFSGSGFTHLALDNLKTSQSSFVLRTDLKNSDKITIKQYAEGSDNTLIVNYLSKPSAKDTLNIPLVSAPAGTDPAMFNAVERAIGFSLVTPRIRTEEKDGITRWVLDGFNVVPNKSVTRSAGSFLETGKKNFLTEVNNLNKRMGDVRDTQGSDGLWVRIMNGTGTGNAGYSDRYTHFQFGFDRKHRLNGADLLIGALMSYTDSHADSPAFSGETRSLGGGLYTSLVLNSGAYVDLIGKYVHHDNNYTHRLVEPGKQNYGTHSWYAGMEAGYRYRLSADMYIEPQAELVYGAVSGFRFNWNADGMDMSMTNRPYNPLTSRIGVAFGKTFTGKDWQLTARAGVDYQFDLVSNGETVLRDASGEQRFTGEKDSRMLYSIGVNARLKDNLRFGAELEQSAFGKYNVNHIINANLRYMF